MLKMMFDSSQILVRKLILFVSTHIDRDIILIKARIDHEPFQALDCSYLKYLTFLKNNIF